jgi:hypothetical protein
MSSLPPIEYTEEDEDIINSDVVNIGSAKEDRSLSLLSQLDSFGNDKLDLNVEEKKNPYFDSRSANRLSTLEKKYHKYKLFFCLVILYIMYICMYICNIIVI